MKNRFILLVLASLFLISLASAWSNNSFNNSLTTENLTFTGIQNITRWLNIPENTIITNGFLNLSGLNHSGIIASTTYNDFGNNEFIFNWGVGQVYYENFTILNNSDNFFELNFTSFFRWGSSPNPVFGFVFSCINYTDGTFIQIGNKTNFSGFTQEEFEVPIECYYNQTNFQLKVDDTFNSANYKMNTIYIQYVNTSWDLFPFNPYLIINNSQVFNQSGIFNTKNRTQNIASYINNYLSICTFVSGICSVPFIFHSDTVGILEYSSMTFNNFGFLENSQTFNSNVQGGTTQEFKINITYDNNLYSGIAAILNYNNTNYTTSTTETGNTIEYSRSVIVQNVNQSTNISFYWIMQLTNDTATYDFFSTSYNQTVSSFLIDNCSTFNVTLLNFTMFDEDSLSLINGTINVNVDLFTLSTTNLIQSYNASFNYTVGSSSAICIDNISTNYTMSYSIQYFGNTLQYFTRYKNIQRMTISNATLPQNVELRNLNRTRGYPFNVIVVGNLLSATGNSGLLVDAQRQYLALNEFKSVESSVTSADGIAVAHLVQNTEVYNFIVSYNNEVLGTFNNYQVKCANPTLEQCSITLNLAQASGTVTDFENYGDISQVFLLDSDNNVLYQTFTSTDGEVKEVNSHVIKDDGFGNTTICNSTVSGTSGTIQCNIPTTYQNDSFFVLTSVNDAYIGSKHFSQGQEINWQGADVLIMLLMFSSLVLLLIGHPITIVIGAIMGLTLPSVLISVAGPSFSSLIGAAIYYISAGIILIVIIRRKI